VKTLQLFALDQTRAEQGIVLKEDRVTNQGSMSQKMALMMHLHVLASSALAVAFWPIGDILHRHAIGR